MKNDILYEIKKLNNLIEKSIFQNIERKDEYKPTSTQIRFIEYMSKHQDDVVTGKVLEDYFHLSKATVSDVLNTMEKHNIIIRTINENDTRVKEIHLNDNIRKRHIKFKNEVSKIKKIITKDIDNKDLIVFNKVLHKMQENMFENIDNGIGRNDAND